MYEEEDYYDDTAIPDEEETDPKTIQQKDESETVKTSDSQTKPSEDAQNAYLLSTTEKPRPLTARKPTTLTRQVQDRLKMTGSAVAQETTQMPSTPGLYYFDGEKFIEQRPAETIYVPSSDYCEVRKARDTDEESVDNGGYESDISSNSEQSHGGVKVQSRLSGLKTLNISIRLNVADLVHASTSRRSTRVRTRRKTVSPVPRRSRSNYENPEPFRDEPGTSRLRPEAEVDVTKEPVENSVTSIVRGSDEAPPRPPRSYMTDGSLTNVETNVSDGNTEEKGAEVTEADYEDMSSVPSDPTRKEGKMKRYYSEPATLTGSAVATGSDGETYDDYYAQIDLKAYDLYASDIQLQSEVKSLLESYKWSYTYTDKQKAEEHLSGSEILDGSFAVICENIEENRHFPFTLLLKYKGNVVRTPIRKTHENRRKRYDLLHTKKETIEKLIQHFKNKSLPDFKVKLR